jgi:hypothetical protein
MIKICYAHLGIINACGRGLRWAEKEGIAKKHRPTVQTQQFPDSRIFERLSRTVFMDGNQSSGGFEVLSDKDLMRARIAYAQQKSEIQMLQSG